MGRVRDLLLPFGIWLLVAGATAAAAAANPDPIGGVIPDGSRAASPSTSSSSAAALSAPTARLANVGYGGGPVMHTNRTHVIYWSPSNAGFGWDPGYQTVINAFLANVAAASHSATSVYGLTGQYRDSTGPAVYDSTFAGALQDSDPAPANGCTLPATAPPWPVCLTTTQLRAEVLAFVTANNLPTGLGDIYFLVTPNGLGSCNSSGCSLGGTTGAYCGFHSRITLAGGAGYILWANIPYQAAPDHCHTNWLRPNSSTADPSIDVIAHEHIETITDPLINAWFNPPESEVADLCVGRVGSLLGGVGGAGGSGYNQVINGGHYFLEEEWSNEDAKGSTDPAVGCRPRDETDPVSFGAPALWPPGRPLNFRGVAQDPDGQITGYDWDFGDGSVHQLGPAPGHVFARSGAYTVTLTVADSSGQIARVAHTIRVDLAPTARLSVRTKRPRAKRAVSFSAAGSRDPDDGIRIYLWRFGDGTSRRGVSVRHTYRRAGRYTVTLTVVDRAGASATASKTVHVSRAKR